MKVTTKITCTALWTKNSVHSAHLAALNKVHRKLDVVQVTMLAARWRIWGICRICISWRQELFSSLQLRLTQILIKLPFDIPINYAPYNVFYLPFLSFWPISNLLICNKIASTTWPQIVAKMMLFLQMCLQGKSWEKFPDSEARRARKVILIIIRCPVSSHLSVVILNASKPQRTACV